jgi:hypothetical protein
MSSGRFQPLPLAAKNPRSFQEKVSPSSPWRRQLILPEWVPINLKKTLPRLCGKEAAFFLIVYSPQVKNNSIYIYFFVVVFDNLYLTFRWTRSFFGKFFQGEVK